MDNDTLIVVVVATAAAAIAYLLGAQRGRRAAEAPAPKAKPKAKAKPKPKKAEEAAEPEPKKTAKTEEAEADAQPAPSKPSLARSELPTPTEEVVPVLHFEEDEENDPTKVGRIASAPPSSTRAVAGLATSSIPPADDGLEAILGTIPPVAIIHPADVKKIVYDEDADADEPARAEWMFLVSATAQTDRGLRRKRNEDSLAVVESKNLFVVADGMGGYRGGDLASQLAVKTMVEAFRSDRFDGPAPESLPKAAADLARSIQMANGAILAVAKKNPQLEGMGTTVCAALFSPTKRRVFLGHVGDSRCYRLRDGVFRQITADHTMAELGVKGPEAQQLSRAVGIWDTVTIDVLMGIPQPGDVYLLCSDGLTKMLSDEVIAGVVRNEEDPKAAVDRLIFFANSRGGKDNITVILVRVVPPNWRPKGPEPFGPAKGSEPPPDAPASKGPPAGASGRHRATKKA